MALTKIKGAGINISATEKLYFDGGGNTYIQESGADVLDFYVGGANMLKLTESSTNTFAITGNTTFAGDVDITGNTTMTTADNTVTLTLTSTDADDNVGPKLHLYRNSGSPAANDFLGEVEFVGRNDNSQDVAYASINGFINDTSDGQEDGRIDIRSMLAGTEVSRIKTDINEVVLNDDSKDVDFRVESDGNANMLFVDAGNNRVGIGEDSPDEELHISANQASPTCLKIEAKATGERADINLYGIKTDNGGFAEILFVNNGDSTGAISCEREGANDAGAIVFTTQATGAGMVEKMRIKSNGEVQFGDSNGTASLYHYGEGKFAINASAGSASTPTYSFNSDTDTGMYRKGVNSIGFATGGSERMRITSSGQLQLGTYTGNGSTIGVSLELYSNGYLYASESTGTSAQYHLYFLNGNGNVGRIETTGSQTNYVTSSDYRLKENEVLISDGLTRLNQLKPYRFNFIADADTTVDGFFAHEVAEVVPEAVSGKKDAVDDGGNIVSQGIDKSKLVPLLVKALQEADDKIDALTARIEALENA